MQNLNSLTCIEAQNDLAYLYLQMALSSSPDLVLEASIKINRAYYTNLFNSYSVSYFIKGCVTISFQKCGAISVAQKIAIEKKTEKNH